jgi:RND superfamily putative drug exporter
MFMRLGSFIVGHRKSVLITYIIAILVAGGIGSLSFSRLDSGGYSDLNSESAKAANYITDTFKVQDPVALLVIDAGSRSVDDPKVAADVASLEKEVAATKGIKRTLSYWSAGNAPSLKSTDGKAAFLFIYADIENYDFDGYGAVGKIIAEKFDGEYKSLEVYAGGGAVVTDAINSKIKTDLLLAEGIAIPLTFILLAFVFGALVASAMPLVVGVGAILGSFFFTYLLTLVADVSVFALNLITGLGLGLGIDYALLIVNRFREEMHNGKSVEESAIITVGTAGKTVFYSGLTVMVTLSALLLFPLNFLKSFGYAGVIVTLFAIFGALIPLPALLAILGKKVDKGVTRKSGLAPKEDGRWATTARLVMARPVPVVIASLAILIVMALPIANIAFAQVDSRVLPESNRAAISSAVVEDRFASFEGSPIEVILPNGAGREDSLNSFLAQAKSVEGITRVGT